MGGSRRDRESKISALCFWGVGGGPFGGLGGSQRDSELKISPSPGVGGGPRGGVGG